MGKRLHSAIKHEVVWGENARFNYAQDYINRIICILAEDDIGYEGDFLEFADSVSADRKKLLENVDKIVQPNNEWYYQEELDEVLEDMEENSDEKLTKEYVHKHLKDIINNSDEKCENVYFAWF